MTPYILPFALFAGLFALAPILNATPWFNSGSLHGKGDLVIYLVQTMVCGLALLVNLRHYKIGAIAQPLMTVAIAFLVLLIWVAPVLLPGAEPRNDGFNPEILGDAGPLFWFVVVVRFIRLVVVVPVMEEVFWRGFLQRYLIKEDFQSVPFGSYSHFSFFGVALAFMLVHRPEDYPAAFVCGILYGWIACRTKSLASCIAAHALTNFLLGIFIMSTRQWGFW